MINHCSLSVKDRVYLNKTVAKLEIKNDFICVSYLRFMYDFRFTVTQLYCSVDPTDGIGLLQFCAYFL